MRDYKVEIEGLKLEKFYSLCYLAHRNVSFYPEERAVSLIKRYSEILVSDLEVLGENTGNYEAKFIEKFQSWMNAKSNTISSMITGPANFPVAKARKSNNREQAAYEDFLNWREKYFKAVNRVATKSPEDDLAATETELERIIALQDEVKEINVYIRKTPYKTEAELKKHLLELEHTKEIVERVELWNGRFKIPGYFLVNNNAKIKRLQDRVSELGKRIQIKESFTDLKFDGGYITISDDRVKIFHDEKPSAEIITKLKKSAFKWSRFWGCWVRKHTANALRDAVIIVGYKKPVAPIIQESEPKTERSKAIEILNEKYK